MKLPQHNPVLRLALIFVGVYALLLVAGKFAGLSNAYRDGLQAVSKTLFEESWDEAFVFIEPGSDPTDKGMDTQVSIINKEQNTLAAQNGTSVHRTRIYFNTYLTGFLLSLFFLSLTVAAPIPIQRKLIGGGIGLLLVQGFVLFRIWVNINYAMQTRPKLELAGSAFTQSIFSGLDLVFMHNIVVAFLVPLVIWILVLFRKDDWKRMGEYFRPAANPA